MTMTYTISDLAKTLDVPRHRITYLIRTRSLDKRYLSRVAGITKVYRKGIYGELRRLLKKGM